MTTDNVVWLKTPLDVNRIYTPLEEIDLWIQKTYPGVDFEETRVDGGGWEGIAIATKPETILVPVYNEERTLIIGYKITHW